MLARGSSNRRHYEKKLAWWKTTERRKICAGFFDLEGSLCTGNEHDEGSSSDAGLLPIALGVNKALAPGKKAINR